MPVTKQDYDDLVRRMFADAFGPALEHLEITSIVADYDVQQESYLGESYAHVARQTRHTVKGNLRDSAHVDGTLVPAVEELFDRYGATLTFQDSYLRLSLHGSFEMRVAQPSDTRRFTPTADAALPEIVAAASAGEITDIEAVQAVQALERMDGSSVQLDRMAWDRWQMTREDGELDDAFRSRISAYIKSLATQIDLDLGVE